MVKFYISGIEKDEDNVARMVFWRASLSSDNGEKAAGENGQTALRYKDPSDPTFVEFNSLTNETVTSWLSSLLDISALETRLREKIDSNPADDFGVPWS